MARASELLLTGAIVLAGLQGGSVAFAHSLPLGDGKVSSSPRSGYVYSCQTNFRGGGAHRAGDWIGTSTWDPTRKPIVEGRVTWPGSAIAITLEGDRRIVRANNLPKHATGEFPIRSGSTASNYDRNPNSIRTQTILLRLPAVPQVTQTPGCVPMGMIGFALSGVAIYNGLDAMGRDAPAYEIQDACNGHPQRQGQYHYHNFSICMGDTRSEAGGHSSLVGYALDGFGLYGPYGADGRVVTNAGLDACHGHTHTVMWNGKPTDIYHYHLTYEYPYTIGCFRGSTTHVTAGRGPNGPPPGLGTAGPGNPGPRGAAVIEDAARELGVSAQALRDAIGPPPPDFARAARVLRISAAKIRRALQRARRAAMQ